MDNIFKVLHKKKRYLNYFIVLSIFKIRALIIFEDSIKIECILLLAKFQNFS